MSVWIYLWLFQQDIKAYSLIILASLDYVNPFQGYCTFDGTCDNVLGMKSDTKNIDLEKQDLLQPISTSKLKDVVFKYVQTSTAGLDGMIAWLSRTTEILSSMILCPYGVYLP